VSAFPYRIPSKLAKGLSARRALEDGQTLAALGFFWAISIVRAVGGLLRHEIFGAEGTLALMAVAVVPWLVWGWQRPQALEEPLSLRSTTTEAP
jgi:hypothetical protein